MNLINLCLRIPNLGIILYYLIFVVIIPYMLVSNASLDILKYYMPLMVAFANLLTLSGHDKLFGNLYQLKPKNFIAFVSTNFINLFALFGILWQCIEYSGTNKNNVTRSIIYGTVLFVIVFPFSRDGLKYVLDQIDYYLRKKTNMTYDYNWHLMAFGLLYIIFLLGLQAVLLGLISGDTPPVSQKKKNSNIIKGKKNNSNETPLKNSLQTTLTGIKAKKNNGRNNGKNNGKNNAKKLLDNISISNINNFVRKRGL